MRRKSKLNKWILNSDQYSAGEKNIDLYGFFFNVIEKKNFEQKLSSIAGLRNKRKCLILFIS